MAGRSRTVGLDFGTTTTLLAVDGGLLPLGEMVASLPSLVGYGDDGGIVVGEDARFAAAGRTLRSIKSAITRHREVVHIQAPDGVREVRADEFVIALLRTAARRAGRHGVDLLEPNTRVTYGCPTVWDHRQRRRFVQLLHRAGLPARMSDLVEEPVAAGLAWLARHPLAAGTSRRVVVFDMGGGTLDIAVLQLHGDARVEVLGAVGRAEAGDELDGSIADDLATRLGVAELDEREPSRARIRRELLVAAARDMKERLSTATETLWALDAALFPDNTIEYTRADLETVLAPQLERAAGCVLQALRIAHLIATGSDARVWPAPATLLGSVDVVLLAGGMSRVPAVPRRLAELFGAGTVIEPACAEPDEAVAVGLSLPATLRRTTRHALDADLVLEWQDQRSAGQIPDAPAGEVSDPPAQPLPGRQSRLLYEAFTPIIEPWWVEREWPGQWRFWCRGADLDLPASGDAVLRVHREEPSAGGEPAGPTLDGVPLDGFPIVLNGESFDLTIHPSGRIELVDGSGTHTGHR